MTPSTLTKRLPPTTVPPSQPPTHDPLTWSDILRCVWSLAWAPILIPILIAHEATHIAAARVLGVPVQGAGIAYKRLGTWRGIPFIEVWGAFVSPGWRTVWQHICIAVAPLLWLFPAVYLHEVFGPYANAWVSIAYLFSLLIGISGFSDVLQLSAAAVDVDLFSGRESGVYRVVVGESWVQTTLTRFV